MREEKLNSSLFTPYSSSIDSQGKCNICYNRYDNNTSKPLLICPQDHCLCKTCLLAIRKTSRCPFCRANIDLNKIRLNQQVLDVVNRSRDEGGDKKRFLKIVQNDRLKTENTGNEDMRE